MDWLAVGKAVSDVGGWAAFLALVALVAVTGLKGKWVFGWMYDRAEARGEKSDIQVDRNTKALETSSEAFELLAKSYDRLELDYARLEARLGRNRNG